MQKINSASRLHSLLHAASRQKGRNRAAYLVWAEFFELDPTENIRTHLGVMEQMLWMQAEIEAILQGMDDLKLLPENLYKPQLTTVLNAIGPLNMAPEFQHTVNVLTADIMNSIGVCAALLPDEERAISEDDIKSLLALATEIETLLEVTSLPPQIRDLIRRHTALIHRALNRYAVHGAKVFQEAAYRGLGELTAVGEKLKPYSDAPEVEKLNDLWSKTGSIADAAIKADGVLGLGQRISDIIEKIPT